MTMVTVEVPEREPCQQPRLTVLWGTAHCPTRAGLRGWTELSSGPMEVEATKDGYPLHVRGYLCGCCLGPSPAWLAALEASKANTLVPFGPFSPTPSPHSGPASREPQGGFSLTAVIIRDSGVKIRDLGGPKGSGGVIWKCPSWFHSSFCCHFLSPWHVPGCVGRALA